MARRTGRSGAPDQGRNLLRRKRGGPDCCSRSCAGAERTERPPEACALFFQPGLEALAHSGWDINLYRQDACWGDIGEMEGLTVLSLAAIYAAHYQQPCGWLARDPLNTLAIGIVKPDGQRQ